MQNKNRVYYQQLLKHYLYATLSSDEIEELFRYISANEENVADLFDEIDYQVFKEKLIQDSKLPADTSTRMYERLHADIGGEKGVAVKRSFHRRSAPVYFLYRNWKAAAVLVLLIGGIYLWFPKPLARQPAQATVQSIIKPGTNRAVLTLSNGTKVFLDSMHRGQVIRQGKSSATNVHNGLLAYQLKDVPQRSGNEISYNTLTTPRGGQYKLILSDGTQVWLNAASSIRYPAAFSQRERKVEITGEAYFEIEKNVEKPFKVVVGKTTINVLGTHFNVMAYPDEKAVKTTLLEGAVKVSYANKTVILDPGQQAELYRDGGGIKVIQADTGMTVAWKNGEFSFNNTDIYEIMRQLSRWYDVDVRYRDSVKVLLNGHIKRDVEASKVFRILELTKEVSFHISGRNIEVSK